jgi:uncharacterized phage-associated protein
MFSAIQIAEYFLIQSPEPLDKLKIQKLLYYAQGLHLALFDTPLFKERILRWKKGPVVREVRNYLNRHKGATVELPLDTPYQLDDKSVYFLNKIADAFNSHICWHLVELTHSEAPWLNTPPNAVMSADVLKDFFSDYVLKTSDDFILATPTLDSFKYKNTKIKYKYIPCLEEGGYVAWVLDRPGCVTSSETLGELPDKVKSAVEDWDDVG